MIIKELYDFDNIQDWKLEKCLSNFEYHVFEEDDGNPSNSVRQYLNDALSKTSDDIEEFDSTKDVHRLIYYDFLNIVYFREIGVTIRKFNKNKGYGFIPTEMAFNTEEDMINFLLKYSDG